MKKIIFLAFIVISIIFIYFYLSDDKIYFFSISDNEYNYNDNYYYANYISNYLDEKNKLENSFIINNNNKRTIDYITDINNNATYNDIKIKNHLIKADLVLLSLGYNELLSKFNFYDLKTLYEMSDQYIKNINELLTLTRENCKETIIFIGFDNIYMNDKYNYIINYINDSLKNICIKNNIIFIDSSDIDNNNLGEKPIYSYNQHISKKIRKMLDENILK